jgi:hypothetical protein
MVEYLALLKLQRACEHMKEFTTSAASTALAALAAAVIAP